MVRLRQIQLPLKDLFINREIEFDFSLEDIKIFNNSFQKTNLATYYKTV